MSCKRGGSSGVEAQVLTDSNLLEKILSNLRLREAAKLAWTCKAFRSSIERLAATEGFYPRCVVACSGNHSLVEVDLRQGDVTEKNPAKLGTESAKRKRLGKQQRALDKQRPNGSSWLTGIAFSPEDRRLYVGQYKVNGVNVYKSRVAGVYNATKFASSAELKSPEGLAFAKGNLYVASADNGTICTISLPPLKAVVIDKVSCGNNLVPWGVISGPDDALYVAVNDTYESEDYARPPPPDAKGNVLRIPLTSIGTFGEVSNFCKPSKAYELKRPSGLCFDPTGRLYVTSMTGQILRFHGPASGKPGELDKAVVQLPADRGNPWDVKCWQGQLVVSVHNGSKQDADARILVLDPESGEELKCIRSAMLDQPNMLAFE